MKKYLALLIFLLGFRLEAQESSFYFGVDLSYVNEMDDCGAVYRENGSEVDAFELFAGHGANLVRARLWHNPDWTAYSTLADVQRTFTRAKAAGMNTLLDFHYSDNWADPGRQEIPAAWEGIEDTGELADTLYQYTYDVLSALNEEGLVPDFVQIGNETNSGMLGGELLWARQARFFNAGIQAVRDFAAETGTNPQIILHVAQPENTGWWFSEAEESGITGFDIIGISYYPQWSSFSISDMGAHVSYLRQRFGKEIMVLETGYGWTREDIDDAGNVLNEGIRGYAFSPEDQLRFMQDLTQSLISNGASGVVYWEPAWVSTDCLTRWGQGSHWENASFFDFQNNNEVLPVINFLDAANYAFPSSLVDAVLESSPFAEDAIGDNLDAVPAYDFEALHLETGDMLEIGIKLAGEVYNERGNYFLYFDTAAGGADVDVARRPITVTEAYAPEYRLDITIREEAGTVSPRFVWNEWRDGAWQTGSFTGSALINGAVIELQIPLSMLNNPQSLNLAVISSDQARNHTAGDIFGSATSPASWDEALVLETFFAIDLGD